MGYTARRSTILTAIVSGIWSDIYHRIRSGRLLLLYWAAASVAHVLNSARFALYELCRSGKRSGFIQTLAARLFVVAFFVIPFYNFAKCSIEQLLYFKKIFFMKLFSQQKERYQQYRIHRPHTLPQNRK